MSTDPQAGECFEPDLYMSAPELVACALLMLGAWWMLCWICAD